MKKIGLTHHPKRKPNGITKADREAMKSDDLLKRDFRSDEPLKNALRILQRLKQKMESSTLPSYSTASIWVFWVLLWVQTWRRSCAFRHWTTQWLLIRLCAVLSFIPTAVLSIQAICTAEQSHGMVSGKAWIVQAVAAMTMLAAKVCGPEWRQNYYTTATPRSS